MNAARWAPATSDAGGQSAQDGWGDQLLGRTAWEDPNSQYGNYHYDYGHHEYVWTDNQGNFQGGDATFDPNLGSDRTWVPARGRERYPGRREG